MTLRKLIPVLALSILFVGCASTPYPSGPASTWVDVGVGYQTMMNGFEGGRDTAKFAIERSWQSGHYLKFEHISHLSSGEINSNPEDTINMVMVGYRMCSSGACAGN